MEFAFLLLLLTATKATGEQPCDYYTSSRIDHGISFPNGSIRTDGILYEPEHHFVHHDPDKGPHRRGCTCLLKRCLRKCCYSHEIHNIDGCINNTDAAHRIFDPTIHTPDGNPVSDKVNDNFAFVYESPCKDQGFLLDINYDEDKHVFLENGSLLMTETMKTLKPLTFCMELFVDGNDTYHSAIVCPYEDGDEEKNNGQNNWNYLLFSLGMIISLPFLFATLLVYGCVPELQNLHGKSLMGYTTGLFFTYIFLITAQMTEVNKDTKSDDACYFIAFGIYFFFMVAFFWLDVLCIDIWWTFRKMKAPSSRGQSETRRFRIYSVYAWGMPSILTGIVALMQFHPDIPDHHVKPGFGKNSCWFEGHRSSLLYFYTPVAILNVTNVVLFCITAYTILSINRETAILRQENSRRHAQYEKNKQRFNLYIKLFLVMGLNWIMEWISVVAGGSVYIWIVMDFCNSLQGIFIFMLFVWKKKVKRLIKRRYHIIRHGSVMSQVQTSSTSYQMGSTYRKASSGREMTSLRQ